jgi:hypothetical protein
MKFDWKVALGPLVVVTLFGCSRQEATPDFRPTGTIKDIMDSMVDPSADKIWESVATIVDTEGIHDMRPQTDDEWAEVRRDAIKVLEATNLLLIPGRDVAEPGANSENPDIELEPAEIQELIDGDRQKWTDLAHGLHDMAMITLNAINNQDADALLNSGQGLDIACERCHLNYWYPNDAEARRLFEENERFYLESQGQVP